MAGFNYYASPYNSPRAIAFREEYAKAKMGEVFWFEGQPYAGPPAPPGLLEEEGAAGTPPQSQDKDSDDYARTHFREYPINPLTGKPEYLTSDISSPIDGKGAMFDTEGNLIPSNPAGSRLPFDDPSIAGTRIPFPEQSQEQMAMALNRVEHEPPRSFEHMYNAPSSVTGRYGPGQDTGPPQGLLGPGYAGQNRTEVEGLRQQVAQGSLPQQSVPLGPEGTDRSGWMGDRRFREANNNYRLASMLFNAGNDLRDDRGWWN
jgi:hypothetical protein